MANPYQNPYTAKGGNPYQQFGQHYAQHIQQGKSHDDAVAAAIAHVNQQQPQSSLAHTIGHFLDIGKNVGKGVVRATVNPMSKLANEGLALGSDVGDLIRVGSANVTHNAEARRRALSDTSGERRLMPGRGIGHQGGVLGGRENTNDAVFIGKDAGKNMKATVGTGVDIGLTVAGAGSGKIAKTIKDLRAGKNAEEAAKVTAELNAGRKTQKALPASEQKLLQPRSPARVEPDVINPKTGRKVVSSTVTTTDVPRAKVAPVTADTVKATDTLIPKADKGARISKPFLSTTGLLTRHGAEGQKLADMVHEYNHTARDFSTEWFNRMPTVSKLKNKEGTNFAKAVQGLEKPINKRVAKAVDEWKTVSPDIRQSFIQHSGEDVGNIENFFPRSVKKEFLKPGSTGFNAAVKHLVDTKQVKNSGEAVQALNFARKSGTKGNVLGSFKFHRNFDLPAEMYDTSKNAIANYLEGAAHSVAGAKVFGMDKSGSFHAANDLIGKIADRGGNADEVKRTFEQAMGLVQHNETAQKITNAARAVNTFTKLGMGAITNAGQTVNTIIKNGFIDTAKGAGYLATPAGRKYARETGAFTHGLINDLREAQGFAGKAGKVGAPFFQNVEQFNRYLAAAAGKYHAQRLAGRVDRGGMLAGRAERDLRGVGVKGDIGKTLTPEQLKRAGRGSSDITQFEIGPHTLPGWAGSPMGKLVSQFQTFSYKQTGFVANEILKPLREGNALPLVRLLAVLPVGYGIAETKSHLRGKNTAADSAASKIMNAWRAAGGGGLPESMITSAVNAKKYAKSGGEFAANLFGSELGPTAGTVVDTTKSAYSASTGDFKPAKKQATKMIPVAGPTIANNQFPSGSDSSRHVASNSPKLAKELGKINYTLQDTSRTSGRAQQLDDNSYKQYNAASSYLFTQRAEQALSDPAYQNLSPEDKKKQMSAILSGARTDVMNHIVGKPKRSKTARFSAYR